ncbi:MAG: RHS domain-containing protein [bacterium]|nr:RHS domain-containing protein [bacterium]
MVLFGLILSPFLGLLIYRSVKKKKWILLVLISLGSFGFGLLAFQLSSLQADTTPGEEIFYYHNDHLGTPIKMTDSSGNVVWSMDCSPFQELCNITGSITNNLRFPGQYYDAETGLHYNGHRYYSTKLGIYTTPDPVGGSPKDPQSFNPFPYVANNPINYFDPFGLTTLTLNVGSCSLTVDPEDGSKSTYNICATSGSGSCKNESKCEQKKDEGPLPRGKYNINANDISNPGRFGDILRNLTGVWGDWRVPINPSPGTETYGRSGFFLHGGRKPGTSGCIDIGGGIFGDTNTDRLLKDLINDPDKKIPLTVK